MRAIPMLVLAVLTAAVLTGCSGESQPSAADFIADAEGRLLESYIETSRAQWVQQTYINGDTEAIAAQASAKLIGTQVELAQAAAAYTDADVEPDVARKLGILRTGITLPAPADAQLQGELAGIAAGLESRYGSGEYCPDIGLCFTLGDLEDVIDASRDADDLLDAWQGWRTISVPMREEYQRFVEIANQGAQELGFDDLGAMWRSKYDMPADDFAAELERLWEQVRPLYESLHCHVRARLVDEYGEDVVDPAGPIPAHVLGNMWAQSWGNIYDLVAPPAADPGYDLTTQLRANGIDEEEMVRIAERFFVSLGLPELPATFWERSQFVEPQDRSTVCHASAWQVNMYDDLRIKMCIDVNGEDFNTIHHELGHSYYQDAYKDQDPLYRDSANDGFHEALGDTVALSITPSYLKQIGLIENEPSPQADLGLLMRMALDKIAFLPFGLLVDQWRWGVFSGEISSDSYNQGWWDLREKYQGVGAPTARSEEDFDPGAKYHIPGNTPYSRYFLAHILQFQLHRDLCAQAGVEGPLHRCSVYGNEQAGKSLADMMEMGMSRPWPEALASVSGTGEMDATAILDFFAPLGDWLEEQNEGRTCGW